MGRPRLKLPKLFWNGLILFIVGSGPLLAVIFASGLGLLDDPNPNPIGFGILAGLTFWPAIIMMLIGFVRAVRSRGQHP